MSWNRTGEIAPAQLWDTRLQLHWAAQAAAGVGRSLLPKHADFSQESFHWSTDQEALLQGLVEGPRPFRSGIRLRDMTLLLIDDRGAIIDQFPMNGRLLSEGYDFYEKQYQAKIARLPEGMPAHAVADGARFNAEPRYLQELQHYYSDANEVLEDISKKEKGAGAVLCWPHHFDIATLITLNGSGEDARTIGVGLAPGDSGIREPYYYVTPWPSRKPEPLPPLARGKWNTEGWFGAALRGSELEQFSGDEQKAAVAQSTSEALRHCYALLKS